MATNYNHYEALQPGSEGGDISNEQEGDNNPPPAFNPNVVKPLEHPTYLIQQQQIQQQSQPQAPSQPQFQAQAQPQQRYIYQQNASINQAQVSVQYVNQYGQPISNTIAYQQQQQPNVVILPQQQPVQAISASNQLFNPSNQFQEPFNYKHPSPKDRRRRTLASIGAVFALILSLSAMSTSTLASGSWRDVDVKCSISAVVLEDSDLSTAPIADAYYSDFCDAYNDEYNWVFWDNTDSERWCNTWMAASLWVSCMTFCGVFSCLGLLWTQPCCMVERCCCVDKWPKLLFSISLILCVAANVLWFANDDICTDPDGFDMAEGSSIYTSIAAGIVIFVTLVLAK